jgi:GNAT superfamily N-acetyltransferase
MNETLRAPREEDAGEVARLMSEGSPEQVHTDTVLRDWTFPGVQVEKDARLGLDSYAFVDSFGDGRVWIDLAGRPTSALLDWAEKRAQEVGSRLISGAWTTQEPLLRELERRGFTLVRSSHRMMIGLGEPTPDPAWPTGVDARSFEPGDEQVFYDLHQETFRDSWEPIEETYDEWVHRFLTPQVLHPALWTLAVEGGEPAGFAMCHPHAVDSELGWVRVLGVRRSTRGRGLGRALLLHAFEQFRRQGMTRAGLGVDATSPTGANKLYESVGMSVSAQFAIHEKDVG